MLIFQQKSWSLAFYVAFPHITLRHTMDYWINFQKWFRVKFLIFFFTEMLKLTSRMILMVGKWVHFSEPKSSKLFLITCKLSIKILWNLCLIESWKWYFCVAGCHTIMQLHQVSCPKWVPILDSWNGKGKSSKKIATAPKFIDTYRIIVF